MIKRLSIFFLLVLSFSCEEQGIFVNCSDCLTYEPTTTNLTVRLDYASYNTIKEINVYEGNLNDSVLYNTYTTSGSELSIPVALNKKYTVTAEYHILENVYIAVDSATPMVRYTDDQCDSPCFYVFDRRLDLRIKYTK